MGASRSLGFLKIRSHLRETQYAEAGNGGITPGWAVRILTGPGDQGLDDHHVGELGSEHVVFI
jgi:hypothetical protein